MNLTDLKISGVNEISLTDSLNAALLGIKIKMGAQSVAPESDDLIIYVDKQSSVNPSDERKQYVFNLSRPLKFSLDREDELVQNIAFKNNKAYMKAYVKRVTDANGIPLAEEQHEELETIDITLFEGKNYIYTNYTNVDITVIYPKNTDLIKLFVNNLIYTRDRELSGDFSLDDIYFKDAFTKMGDELIFEVDNVCAKSFTSKNNKFSIDEEGNIIANSLTVNGTTLNGSLSPTDIVNLIYPVGSLYLSVNDVDPSTIFGGTWERITGYYLYAGEGNMISGSNSSGGPSTNVTGETVLTIEQMPSHTHSQNPHSHGQHNDTWMNDKSRYDTRPSGGSGYYMGANLAKYYTDGTTATNNYTGGGKGHTHTLSSHTHSINPLRFEAYTWKRTA